VVQISLYFLLKFIWKSTTIAHYNKKKLKNELRKCVAVKEQPHQWAACDVPKLKNLMLDYERKKD